MAFSCALVGRGVPIRPPASCAGAGMAWVGASVACVGAGAPCEAGAIPAAADPPPAALNALWPPAESEAALLFRHANPAGPGLTFEQCDMPCSTLFPYTTLFRSLVGRGVPIRLPASCADGGVAWVGVSVACVGAGAPCE